MRSFRPFVILTLSFSAACGGGSKSTGVQIGGVTNGTFRATLDGAVWSPIGTVIVQRPTATSIGMFAVSTTYAMTIVVLNVSGPGTTSLDASVSNGSHASVSKVGTPGWNTGNTGGTGSVVITTLTPSHVVGTFSFDAPSSGAGAAIHVTSGTFDLTY